MKKIFFICLSMVLILSCGTDDPIDNGNEMMGVECSEMDDEFLNSSINYVIGNTNSVSSQDSIYVSLNADTLEVDYFFSGELISFIADINKNKVIFSNTSKGSGAGFDFLYTVTTADSVSINLDTFDMVKCGKIKGNFSNSYEQESMLTSFRVYIDTIY